MSVRKIVYRNRGRQGDGVDVKIRGSETRIHSGIKRLFVLIKDE
jgi:hypothetical protein